MLPKADRLFATMAAAIAGAFLSVSPLAAQPSEVTEPEESQFEATQAWGEFEQVLRLFYAYLDRTDFDVEAHISRTAELAKQAATKEEFRKVLHQSTYAWTDPHLIVGPFDDDDYNIIPSSSDLVIGIQDHVFSVVDVRAGSAADDAGIRPGWRLVAIDGLPIETAVRTPFGKLVPRPTITQLEYAATLVANGKRKGNRQLTFLENGGVSLTLPSPRDFALEVSELQPVTISRTGHIGIVRFNNSLGNNDTIFAFDAAMEQIGDAGGLIIDLRNTPSGGNTEVARSIIGHFMSDTQAYQIHEIPSLEREFTVPRRFIEQVKPRLPYYNPERVVVLGGHWTGSMGEGIVIGLDAAADAFVISSDMGDLLGALRNITLPTSGARVDLGSETLFHVDGTPREDFVADMPLSASDRNKAGGDPAIEAALKYLSEN